MREGNLKTVCSIKPQGGDELLSYSRALEIERRGPHSATLPIRRPVAPEATCARIAGTSNPVSDIVDALLSAPVAEFVHEQDISPVRVQLWMLLLQSKSVPVRATAFQSA